MVRQITEAVDPITHYWYPITGTPLLVPKRLHDVRHAENLVFYLQLNIRDVYSCATAELMSRASFSTVRSRVANRSTLSDSLV